MTLDPSSRPGALGRRFIDIHDERCAAVLQILEAGWERASGAPDVHTGTGEVEITERLRKGMRAALAAKTAGWCKKMTVLPGTESSSSRNVSATRRTHGHSHLLQRRPRGIRRTRSARDRRVQASRRESRRSLPLVRRQRHRPFRGREVRGQPRGWFHSRVPALGRCSRGGRGRQPPSCPHGTPAGAAETLHSSRRALDTKQPSSAPGSGRADHAASRFLQAPTGGRSRAAGARGGTVTKTNLYEMIAADDRLRRRPRPQPGEGDADPPAGFVRRDDGTPAELLQQVVMGRLRAQADPRDRADAPNG